MLSFLILDLFQILVFGLVLFRFLPRETSERFLYIIFIGGCIAMMSKILYYYLVPGNSMEMTISSTLCFSAMAHLYLRELFFNYRIQKNFIFLHLVPYFITILLFSYAVINIVYPGTLLINDGASLFLAKVAKEIRTYFLVFYLLLDLQVISKHPGRLLSSQGTICGSMLIYFIVHKGLLIALIFISGGLGVFQNITIYIGLLSMPFILGVITYYRVLLAISQKSKKLEASLEKYLLDRDANLGPKYAKSKADDEKYKYIAQQVKERLMNEKAYLDMSFNAKQLAEALKISQYDLSMSINQHLQSSFYEYINAFRIDYFLSHISKVVQQESSILSLAYESGFNSKSTFNKYFKKIVGMSPTDYVKKRIIEEKMS